MKSEKVVFFLFVFLFCLFFSSHQSNEYQLYPQQLTSQSLCEILLIMSSLQVACTGCLRKKYGVADYEYFKNDNTQQCKIFRHNKCNFSLAVCEISTPYIKHEEIYELEKNDGSIGTFTISNNKFTHERILSSKSLQTHHFFRGHNFSYL